MHELLYRTIASDVARERALDADRARLVRSARWARSIAPTPGFVARIRAWTGSAAGHARLGGSAVGSHVSRPPKATDSV